MLQLILTMKSNRQNSISLENKFIETKFTDKIEEVY